MSLIKSILALGKLYIHTVHIILYHPYRGCEGEGARAMSGNSEGTVEPH